MVWCGSKIRYKKKLCFKKIELCAQYMITIMDSTVNIIQGEEGLYDHFMSTRMFTMIMDKVFI